MNAYEIAELEACDFFCSCCGRQISVATYLEYDGMCEECALKEGNDIYE